MKKILLVLILAGAYLKSYCWGFYAHKKINYYAVFLLPPPMLVFYKSNINFLSEHAVDPDKRRYAIKDEGPRHYIDINYYGEYPYDSLPHKWNDAVAKYSEDSLLAYGIVPWHVQIMLSRLTNAFREKNFPGILKNSAEIGHYIADAHVPLHAHTNHNGQYTNQRGIHGFWESRVPELLAEKEFDFFIGHVEYIKNPSEYTWNVVLESAKAADSVLSFERILTKDFPADRKYAFETRNNLITRQYSTEFTKAFNKKLNGMVERRMRKAIFCVSSFWYTAWVNAGQPDLKTLMNQSFSETDLKEFENLDAQWRSSPVESREHE